MVSINPENVNNLVKNAEEALKSKTFGGVSKESAIEGMQKVAEGVKKMAADAIGAVQQELQAYKGKTAKEMADLTSQKDKFQTLAQQETQRADKAEGFIERVVKYTKTREGKPRQLPNGNTETVKVNKNGARMTTERTPEGKVVQTTVENIDGDVRKTKYNPVTGKPVKTFDNVNGDKTIEYTDKGAKIKDVNVKKVKAPKPKVVNETVLQEDRDFSTIQRAYSDGSYDMIEYSKGRQQPISEGKFTADNKLVSQTEHEFSAKNNETIKTTKYNPETGNVMEKVSEFDGRKIKDTYNDAGRLVKREEKTKDGLKRTISAKADKYGNVDASNPTMKYVYPKNSKIKSSSIEFERQFYANKETLQMKDGSTVTMGINGNYDPYKVTINKPGESPKVLDREEGKAFLDEIGKVGYNQDRDYFSNVLR